MASKDINTPLVASQPTVQSTGDVVKGLSLFSLGITLFSIYTMCVKVAEQQWRVNVPELYYYIQLINIVFYTILMKIQNIDVLGEANRPGVKFDLFFRVFCGSFADVCLFLAFGYTNYSRAFCIFFTNNMMLPFFAKAMLGEKIKFWDIVGILAGFVGVLILVQPWKVPDSPDIADGAEAEEQTFANDMIGCGIAVIAAILAAFAITFMRRLAQKIRPEVIPLYYAFGSASFMPIWTLFANPAPTPETLPKYGWQMYLFMVLIACISFFQQGLMAFSMQYNTIGAVAVILYMAIPLGYLLDFIFFKISLTNMEILGASIIVVVNITIALMRILGCIDKSVDSKEKIDKSDNEKED